MRPYGLAAKAFQAADIACDPIVSVMPMELAAQRRPLFLDRHVSVCSAPQIHPLDRLPQLLAGRLALDHPVALT